MSSRKLLEFLRKLAIPHDPHALEELVVQKTGRFLRNLAIPHDPHVLEELVVQETGRVFKEVGNSA